MAKKSKADYDLTEAGVIDVLKARYSGNAWAFLPKVRNATGWSRVARTADAIAMSLWPSRGLDVYGIEVKVDRADWLRELRDPEKAEEIFQFCDRWLIVATPDVVKLEELPSTWGLMEVRGKTTFTIKEPPKLEPKPVDRGFLAALLRKVTENMASEQLLDEARRRGSQEGYKDGVAQTKREVEYANEKLEKLEARVQAFEKATRIQIDVWRPVTEVAAAVNAVLNGEDKRILDRLRRVRGQIAELVSECDRAIEFKEKTEQPV